MKRKRKAKNASFERKVISGHSKGLKHWKLPIWWMLCEFDGDDMDGLCWLMMVIMEKLVWVADDEDDGDGNDYDYCDDYCYHHYPHR